MSDNKKKKDIMENKRSRQSPNTFPSANKKHKVESTQGGKTASSSRSGFGNATDSDQESVQDEGKKQVQSDTSPPNGNLVGSGKAPVLEDKEQPKFESPNSDHFEGLVIDEEGRQGEPDDSAPDHRSKHPDMPQLLLSGSTSRGLNDGSETTQTDRSHPQGEILEAVLEASLLQTIPAPRPAATSSDDSRTDSSSEESLSEDDSGSGDDEDGELNDESVSGSDEEQEQSGDYEQQEQFERVESATYRLDLRVRANCRQLESATDLKPRVKLSKEQTVHAKDFKVLRLIGKGAYGKVFVVRKLNGFDAGQVYAMKVISKMDVIHSVETANHVKSEREVLEVIQGVPFVVCLQYAFQTKRYLYLVMDFIQGGELYSTVLKHGSMPERDACLYIAEVVLAVEQLHTHNILYRDLKLENVLIDNDGHVVLADFGLATILTHENHYRAYNFCGTLEYMAPEVIRTTPEGYDMSADCWSVGVLVFEVLTGISPFSRPKLPSRDQRVEVEKCIIYREPELPSDLSPQAVDLIHNLLQKDPNRRMRIGQIRDHPFFRDIDWKLLSKKGYPMPFVPLCDAADDVQYFDSEFTNQERFLPQCRAPPSSIRLYRGFNYTAPKFLDRARQQLDEGIVYRNLGVEKMPTRPYDFVLQHRVYSGGFGSCYMLQDRYMAKIVHRSSFRLSEVDALKSCSHSNIVNFCSAYWDKTEIWIVTELLHGMDLSWFIRNDKLDEQVCRNIFVQLVMAVRHVHRKRFIHGDLKPENVVCDNEGIMDVKLVGFSHASYNKEFRQWQDRARYTLDYAPPELLSVNGYAIYSPAVDIYGLGATLYCMVVGHPPYRVDAYDVGQSSEAKAHLKEQIKEGSFNQNHEKWLTASPAFRRLVRWCLKKHPEDRPTLSEILNDTWYNNDVDEDEECDQREHFVEPVYTVEQNITIPQRDSKVQEDAVSEPIDRRFTV